MLEASAKRIRETLDDSAVVLDIGGWGKPFTRADWVVDQMPYETRGLYGRDGDDDERFTAETWVQRDICDRDAFPFEDNQFDFVICSHTLEDIRDPIWVCAEINRIGKAGYIEVPSRLEEQTYGVHGPWVGWSHHRWLVDVGPDRIEFSFKPHAMHGRNSDHFPRGFNLQLTEEERVEQLWWEGSFDYAERIFIEDPRELDDYLADFVSANGRGWKPPVPPLSKRVGGLAREAAKRLRP
ncbi:MAG: methyltransferase domain-containing protein [Acidimicrobiia bacterium]|nr:methyltransferase domain-containing protein [Acidimicrobiia bacterium]